MHQNWIGVDTWPCVFLKEFNKTYDILAPINVRVLNAHFLFLT